MIVITNSSVVINTNNDNDISVIVKVTKRQASPFQGRRGGKWNSRRSRDGSKGDGSQMDHQYHMFCVITVIADIIISYTKCNIRWIAGGSQRRPISLLSLSLPRLVDSRFPGNFSMDVRVPPLQTEILLESNPLKSRTVPVPVRRLAVDHAHITDGSRGSQRSDAQM